MKRDSFPRDNSAVVFGASRRDLLKALVVAGAGATLPFGASLAQVASTTATRAKAGPIDVHHHMLPPAYVKAMEKEAAASRAISAARLKSPLAK